MSTEPPLARVVAELPSTVPFVGPEAIERRSGRRFRLRLGANESLFGPSPRAVEAMRDAIVEVANYGDPENAELRATVARVHGVPEESVSVGSGIDDLLGLAVRAYVEPGTAVVTSLGTYPTFNYHVGGYGGHLEFVPYRHDRNDLDGLAAAARRVGARLVYLANPDNPTGTWHNASDIENFLERLPSDCILLLDEAYVDFGPSDAVMLMEPDRPNVVHLRTFSKAHGMAGARIGYAVAPAGVVAAFDKIRLHFGVNRIAQAGALASLADDGYIRQVVAAVDRGRREYADLSRELGLSSLPSAANFVAIDVGDVDTARGLLAALERSGVFVRKPTVPPLDRCVRVTVAPPDQRAEFAAILRAIWKRGIEV